LGKLIIGYAIQNPTPAVVRAKKRPTDRSDMRLTAETRNLGKERCRLPSARRRLARTFGIGKGGAAGRGVGMAQYRPMKRWNLHFTGDFTRIHLGAQKPAGARCIDNHIVYGQPLLKSIAPRRLASLSVDDENASRALRADHGHPTGGLSLTVPARNGVSTLQSQSESMASFVWPKT